MLGIDYLHQAATTNKVWNVGLTSHFKETETKINFSEQFGGRDGKYIYLNQMGRIQSIIGLEHCIGYTIKRTEEYYCRQFKLTNILKLLSEIVHLPFSKWQCSRKNLKTIKMSNLVKLHSYKLDII